MPKKSSSKKVRVALNGLGRIGRIFLRQAIGNPNFEIAALHSRSSLETYAHLLKYDSTYGIWDREVKVKGNILIIDGIKMPYVQETDGVLPWKQLGVDIVVDATGKYNKREAAAKHLQDGAKYMLATAPMDNPDETLVYGINHKNFKAKEHKIISAASCTTVCSTLVMKVLEENFGVKQGFINTVHAYTSDQSILDNSHKDLRRARTAGQSIIPTSSGVSKTIVKVYPHLKGKMSAISLRVTALNPSIICLTAVLAKKTTKEEINKAFVKAAKGELKKHLSVSDLPLVSVDFRGNPHGAIVDLPSTDVVDGSLLSLLAWYDNEWGYVRQAVYLLEYLSKQIVK
ncbi:MAG: glyceraldehyde 3-phosphate dehydrogenase NAD-binding domain-containing protein [Patescibacteria group bacterium]